MHYKIDSKESSPKTNTVKDEEGKRKTNIVLIGVEFMCDRVGRTAYKEYPPPSLKPKSKNFSKFSAFKQKF